MNREELTMNMNELSEEELEAVSGGCVSRFLEGANDKIAGKSAKKRRGISYWIGYHMHWW